MQTHRKARKRFGVVTDHLGTPNLHTTEAGALAWKAQLDVYGVPREEAARVAEADRTANPWRFPGQYEDAETGLCYNRFHSLRGLASFRTQVVPTSGSIP